MNVLPDTNILARMAQPGTAASQVALDATDALGRRGDTPCLLPQVLYELWVVATRPAAVNGVSFTVNPKPTATFTAPASVTEGTTDAQVTFTNQLGGNGGYTYSYDFSNNGTFDIVNSSSAQATIPSSDLSTPGPYTVHARITDSLGGYTDYWVTINVTSA